MASLLCNPETVAKLSDTMEMEKLNDVLECCQNLDEILDTGWNVDAVKKHLSLMDERFKLKIPEFSSGLEWLNVTEPLSLGDNLKGKIIILDFFTYCCINCMHILPDLEALEHKYSVSDGVLIVGVHSAKFENEKVSANILSAVLRYGIHHPVVNDNGAKLWSDLQIACWPTLVIVGPDGQFLYQLVGEGHRERLLKFTEVAVNFYKEKGALRDHPLPIQLCKAPESPLSFPGKVCVSKDGQTVVIADTGHHRVIVTDSKGLVKNVIGGTERGYKGGNYTDARFSSPQGLALNGTDLYVADTDNHAIRKVDLKLNTVTTVAGTGNHGNDKEGGKIGSEQPLSSPWDVCLGCMEDSDENTVLYIAMAGSHQIWAYALKEGSVLKNRDKVGASWCGVVAGSGVEENRNNSYPLKAGFAQPSGLSVSTTNNMIYVADSESSSVRSLDLKSGAVKNVAGGDIDPRNLFAYGDEDGKGTKAKLQHPLGVAMVTNDGPLLVADSYNHKIKRVDPTTRQCETMMGTGKPGGVKGDNLVNTELNEPGGLCVDTNNNKVYIADTNNHEIKVLELKSKTVYTFPIIFPEEDMTGQFDQLDTSEGLNSPQVEVKLLIGCAPGVHLNEEAPNSWKLFSEDESIQAALDNTTVNTKGSLSHTELNQTLTSLPESVTRTSDILKLSLKLSLFVCEDSGICRMDNQVLTETFGPQSDLTFDLKVS